MRYAGAKGQLTVRADSGFYSHGVVQVCRKTDVRFSITVRLSQSLRDVIEAIYPCFGDFWSIMSRYDIMPLLGGGTAEH